MLELLVIAVLAGTGWWFARRRLSVRSRLAMAVPRLMPRRPMDMNQLVRRIHKATTETVWVGVSGKAVLASHIDVLVHPDDITASAGALPILEEDLSAALAHTAHRHGWKLASGPAVKIRVDPIQAVGYPKAVPVWRDGETSGSQYRYLAAGVAGSVRGGAASETDVMETRTIHRPGQNTGRTLTLEPSQGGARLEIHLKPGTACILGRDRACDVRVADDSVSRRHCQITYQDGRVTIEDLDSANGTFVDDRPADTPTPINTGATLEIGLTTWKVVHTGGPDTGETHEWSLTGAGADESAGRR